MYIPPVNGHLNCFPLFAIVNNVALNMGIQIPVQVLAFGSLGYIPRSEISGSYGNSMFNFGVFLNYHIIFHSACTILHSTSKACVPILLSFVFLLITTLMGVKWCHIMVFICILLLISYVEHLFMCFLAICISSLEKCLFRSYAHFWIGLFFF